MARVKLTEPAAFSRSGPLVTNDTSPVPWVMRFPCRLDGIVLGINPLEAAADQDIIVDVLKNGTTIFTNTALRPRIIAGQFRADWSAGYNGMTVDFARTDLVQVKVIQAGSGSAPGFGLSVGIEYSRLSA